MKASWTTRTLGDLCTIELGRTPSRSSPRLWDKELETDNVWLSIADLLNVTGKVVHDSKERISDTAASQCKIVKKGTLLVSFKLTLGRLAYAGRDLFTNEAIAALTIGNEKELCKEFLYYFLTFFDWKKAAENDVKLKGMTMNKAKLKLMPVHYPNMEEQRRIVAVLDEAFAGIAVAKANAEQNLKNARALFESHLHSTFANAAKTSPSKPLGSLCKTTAGGTPLKNIAAYYDGGTIPWLMSGEVSQGEIHSATKFITDLGLANSSAKLFPPNTVLIAMYGATAGQVGILRFEASTNQAVCGILPTARFSPEFLFYFFLSQKQILIDQATGNAQPNISQQKIKDTPIPVLADTDQQRIVNEMTQIDLASKALVKIYESKLVALDELKKALLHKAFAGEL